MASQKFWRLIPARLDARYPETGTPSYVQVLNLLLFSLRKQLPQPELLAFLRVDEHLVDIGDDLVDYEEDILENCFNIYRGALQCQRSSVGGCCALAWRV